MAKIILATPFNFMVLVLLLMTTLCEGQLSSTFYDNTCPDALATIRTSIRSSISSEKRMAASLIRLHFHDCFVQGCDASILLDDTATFTGEQNAFPNINSARGYQVIAKAKSQVENICPGIVSCADILSVAVRDASVAVGGPSWTVNLGRRDSLTASQDLANQELPSFKEPLEKLISIFDRKGLSETDLVALSGAHTLGQAKCEFFRDRIYSISSDIDAGFASTRKRGCPEVGGDSNLAPLDLVTPNSFDYNYFKNLLQKKGLLESDQVLFSGGSTDSIVTEFSKTPAKFSAAFASAMVKMGDIEPLTGSNGEIRKICSAIN